jgi:hypothetical protein
MLALNVARESFLDLVRSSILPGRELLPLYVTYVRNVGSLRAVRTQFGSGQLRIENKHGESWAQRPMPKVLKQSSRYIQRPRRVSPEPLSWDSMFPTLINSTRK